MRRDAITVGTCQVRQLGAKVGSFDGHVIPNSVIKRILRAQETIFKYGTMMTLKQIDLQKRSDGFRVDLWSEYD